MKTILKNGYSVKPINNDNHNEIKQLYDLCSDYHIMASGRIATDENVDDIFKYNEKKTIEDSLTLGIYNNDEILVGIVDIFKNYPEIGTWMIGLLLLSPSERNKKLGRDVHEEIKRYALSEGAIKLRIGVLEDNINGRRFWDSLEYQYVKTTIMHIENKNHNVDILSLLITEQ
ncbi:GNAT family N-acetyltransferase [Paraclostridium dentum]|uniref:GNAT family N-acetyltransferase n=1 Tax=Paraclostridium dentum TaxID=2662455 RepID=UPI003B0046A9